MDTFQIVLIGLILFFVGFGVKDGFIVAVGRILGAIIGFLAARSWYAGLAERVDFLPEQVGKIFSFLFLFLLVSRVSGWLFKLLDRIFGLLAIIPFLKSFNRLLGGFLGLLESVVVIGGFFWFLRTFSLFPTLDPFYESSWIAQWMFGGFSFLLGSLL